MGHRSFSVPSAILYCWLTIERLCRTMQEKSRGRRTEEPMMRADTPPDMIDAGTSASVTLTTVQHEVGMRRGTLGHPLAFRSPIVSSCGDRGFGWRAGSLHPPAGPSARDHGHGVCVGATPGPYTQEPVDRPADANHPDGRARSQRGDGSLCPSRLHHCPRHGPDALTPPLACRAPDHHRWAAPLD